MGAIYSTKIPTGLTGKSGPPEKVDQFFRNFSGWAEPIHRVLDRNFWQFLNGSRPAFLYKCASLTWPPNQLGIRQKNLKIPFGDNFYTL